MSTLAVTLRPRAIARLVRPHFKSTASSLEQGAGTTQLGAHRVARDNRQGAPLARVQVVPLSAPTAVTVAHRDCIVSSLNYQKRAANSGPVVVTLLIVRFSNLFRARARAQFLPFFSFSFSLRRSPNRYDR